MKKSIIIAGILVVSAGLQLAAESEDGGYAGAFLKMAVEARPTAMGGAYIAVSDDPAGQLHNPAGTAAITKKVFTSSYRAMKLGRSLGFLSVVFPARLESVLGLSWLYAGYGEVEEREANSFATGKMVSSSEHVFAINFAKKFVPYLSLGTKLNYYHKNVADLTSNSIGINLGAVFYIDSLFEYGVMEGKFLTDIRGGFVIENAAAKYVWEYEEVALAPSQTDDFPIVVGFGASGRTLDRNLLFALDIVKNARQDALIRFGAEYNFDNMFLIRSGLDDGVITAGAGFKFEVQSLTFSINYAFSDDRVGEGSDHIITFDINM
jgi:hypothetical protein